MVERCPVEADVAGSIPVGHPISYSYLTKSHIHDIIAS